MKYMPRFGAKVDANQKQIVRDLQKLGFSCWLTPIGGGFPDIIIAFKVFFPAGGSIEVNMLIEIKNKDGKNKVSKSQIDFHNDWKGPSAICRNLDEILTAMEVYKKKILEIIAAEFASSPGQIVLEEEKKKAKPGRSGILGNKRKKTRH